MTEQNHPDTSVESFADLPLQPTGSGVADLEIAFEQMKLAENDEPEGGSADARTTEGTNITVPGRDDDGLETEAHPS